MIIGSYLSNMFVGLNSMIMKMMLENASNNQALLSVDVARQLCHAKHLHADGAYSRLAHNTGEWGRAVHASLTRGQVSSLS